MLNINEMNIVGSNCNLPLCLDGMVTCFLASISPITPSLYTTTLHMLGLAQGFVALEVTR